MGTKRWTGTPPHRCELCNRQFTPTDRFFWDFKTRMGPWALGCEACFKKHGIGEGTGMGQKYDLKTKEKIEAKKCVMPIRTLLELKNLAHRDERYYRLLCLGSSNLGGPVEGLDECFRWLECNAYETDEAGVVAEVNGLIDLLDGEDAGRSKQ